AAHDAHAVGRYDDLAARGALRGVERAGGHQPHPPLRWRVRRSSQKKNGPPTSAGSMPMGMSAFGTEARAARPATVMSTAPPSAEAVTSGRWAGPRIMRMR